MMVVKEGRGGSYYFAYWCGRGGGRKKTYQVIGGLIAREKI